MQSNLTEQKSIKVTVILPSLNVHKYIGECIDSVCNQTLKNIEIICVDAGSTDGTLEILQEKASLDDRIVLLHSDARSYGHQVNMGIDLARGEYIAIVETDDFVEPNMYEALSVCGDRLQADVVKGPYTELSRKNHKQDCYYREIISKKLPLDCCFSAKEHGEVLQYHASVWAAVYRTSYLRNNNIRFVEAPGAGYVDVGFRIDTMINTEKLAWLDQPLYCYRVDAAGSSTAHFKLPIMITRWREAHEKFVAIQDDYDKYYGPYLLDDEYLNTLAYLHRIPVEETMYEAIVYNLSYVKRVTVIQSVLSQQAKEEIFNVWDNTVLFYSNAQKYIDIKSKLYMLGGVILPKGSLGRLMVKKLIKK